MAIFIYQTQVNPRVAFYVANTVFSSRQTPAILAFLELTNYSLLRAILSDDLKLKLYRYTYHWHNVIWLNRVK